MIATVLVGGTSFQFYRILEIVLLGVFYQSTLTGDVGECVVLVYRSFSSSKASNRSKLFEVFNLTSLQCTWVFLYAALKTPIQILDVIWNISLFQPQGK